MTRKILVAEDDADIALLVQLHLSDQGYAVDIASDGLSALAQARAHSYDLVILDVMMPGMDGLEVCRLLRSQPHYPLILMLTARSTEMDRILGLEIGADDYLTKPFSIRELLARVKALFRRIEAMGNPSPLCPTDVRIIRVDGLIIDREKRLVTLQSQPISLTAKEFDLLLLFACHPGRVYDRSQLLDLVWGIGYEGYEHTVNSHINRLGLKLSRTPAHPAHLLTVWELAISLPKPLPETRL